MTKLTFNVHFFIHFSDFTFPDSSSGDKEPLFFSRENHLSQGADTHVFSCRRCAVALMRYFPFAVVMNSFAFIDYGV